MNPEQKYYILIDGETRGPYAQDTLRAMIFSSAADVTLDTLWAMSGSTEWKPLSSLFPDLHEPHSDPARDEILRRLDAIKPKQPLSDDDQREAILQSSRIGANILLITCFVAIAAAFIWFPVTAPGSNVVNLDRLFTRLGIVVIACTLILFSEILRLRVAIGSALPQKKRKPAKNTSPALPPVFFGSQGDMAVLLLAGIIGAIVLHFMFQSL